MFRERHNPKGGYIMTREEAVKRVLLVVGENPITVSPNDEVYQMAQQLLDMITLDVLGMGWRFNTHYLEDGTEAIDTYVVDVDDYTTEEDLFNANFAAIPVHIQQVIVARTSYEFSLGYTGENLFSEDLSKMYLMALQQARGTEVMLSAELIDFERIYKNVASQLLNEEGWWWNTTETGEDFQTNTPLNLPPIADSYAKIKAQRLFQAYNTADVELMLNPTPEEKEIYAQMVKQNRRHFLRSLPVEELRDSYINELRAEGMTSALTYDEARFSDALAASYADIKAKRMYMLVTEEVNREAYINPSQDEINLYTRLKARQLNKVSHFDDLEALTQEIEDQLKNEIGWYFNTELDEFGQKKLKEVIVLPEEVKAYAKLKARRLFNAFQRGGDVNLVNTPTPEETQAYQQLWLKNHSYWLESETLEQFRDSIIQSLNSEGLTQYLSYSIETNGLIKHYADLKAKRLYSLYNSIDPTPFINATKEEEDLYKRILKELNKPTKVNESDIAEAVASLTKVPANDPSIVHYARMKANRINYAYETGNMELLINMPPEELQAYQAILLKSKREKFNITLENLYNEILNSVLAMFPNINETNATVVEYANLKSRRLYALYTELDPNFAQQSNDETQLLQELYRQNLTSELQQTTYDDVLTAIRQQLLNEAGWWYNTSTDANGNLITRIPDTLPEIVEQYAVARAKRLYRAYQNNQMELILNPSPEEQELYSKMLEMHNRVTRGGKSLEQLKKDILTEVLLEGWSFNIKEQPYREIKAANLVLLKATALYPQLKVYVDKDNKIIDHKTYAEIPEETVVQVVHKVAYDELPELFKLYIDMKASRMYNYYNTINSQINSPLAWARPTADELLLFQKLKTLYAVDIENANILENDTLQYWGRRYR